MSPPAPSRAALFLTVAFVALIAAVPISQTWLELRRGERVQFTDVFRYAPTASQLRQYEATLKEKSWLQQQARPLTQRLLFEAFRDPGAKVVPGRDGWLFYRPDLRYLVEPDLPTAPPPGRWLAPGPPPTARQHVLRTIATFRDQLKERGIALVVMPVPGKPRIHPEAVTTRAESSREPVLSPTRLLLAELARAGVPVIDLYAPFDAARRDHPDQPLYLARDTHWTPTGVGLAAETAARTLRQAQLAPAGSNAFQTVAAPVRRHGDIVEMMQIPGVSGADAPETVTCDRVLDPVLGPLLPNPSERPGVYRYPGQQATVLVLGDSFSRIYQLPEPRTLGEWRDANAAAESPGHDATKRLLPGSAGFISLLARTLRSPVDAIVSDGGASTDVRRKLSTNPEILEGKRVVIWEFVERDIALGAAGWEDVPLPPN